MKTTPSRFPGVLLLEPKVFGDERGFFLESYNEKVMADLGILERFVQDNRTRAFMKSIARLLVINRAFAAICMQFLKNILLDIGRS